MWLCVWLHLVKPLSRTHTLLLQLFLPLSHPLHFPPAPYLPSTHTAKYCFMQECVSVCVCTVHVCKQRCTVFHSWIKPGQRPRGLQVNVAYFKRLFLHGHRVSEAHLHTHAFREEEKKKESQQEKASGCGLHICLFFVCFVKSACSLSLCFPFFLSFFPHLPVPNICHALYIFFSDPSVLLPCITFFLFLYLFLPCFFFYFLPLCLICYTRY